MQRTDIQNLFVDVILPVAVPNLYTYHVPDYLSEDIILPGMRTNVQFGKRKLFTALIVRKHHSPPEDYKTKPLLAILDNQPVIHEWQIKFWEWMADYYMCNIGEVFVAALPNGLRPEGQTQVYLNPVPEEGLDLNGQEDVIYQILNAEPGITIEKLNSLSGYKQVMPALKRMIDRSLVTFEESLKEKIKPLFREDIILHSELQNEASINEILNRLERRAPKQSEILLSYLHLSGYLTNNSFNPVAKTVLLKKANSSSTNLKPLIDKEIFQSQQVEVSRLDSGDLEQFKPAELSDKQQTALNEIKEHFTTKNTVLLHGVTSSGKTELYIHLIEEQLKQSKQVLFLLPEIALTTQIITRLQRVFGKRVGVYHSKYTDSQRVEIWNNLLGILPDGATRYDIILGVRSSLFLPFKNLGLIIVDEEHENTYKQFDPAPRYHARDSAIVLAALHKAKVLLGSATPSLESFTNCKIDKYGFVGLYNRHMDIKLPEIEVVNIREAHKKKQMSANFSATLINEIQRALNEKEQVILFQNRRGFSPYLECADCGWIPECRHCDVSLTYHKGIDKLICHYCGYSIPAVHQCKACGSTNIQAKGFGTQKIEDDLKLILPNAKVARMDLDSTRKKNAYENLIGKFSGGEIDILIGTQMVSKGLDFDNVSLVGIMNADNMLNFPDFRAYERSFQLMAQVSGRAGRKKKQGKVIIQTGSPANQIIQQVVQNDYDTFFTEQMTERKQFFYPPFFRLINISLKHKQRDSVNRGAAILVKKLRIFLGNRVLGPQPPLISRIQNWQLQSITIKLEKNMELGNHKKAMLNAIIETKQTSGLSGLQINIDVDPY